MHEMLKFGRFSLKSEDLPIIFLNFATQNECIAKLKTCDNNK